MLKVRHNTCQPAWEPYIILIREDNDLSSGVEKCILKISYQPLARPG
ncbi:hypothetical protein L682_21605 [Aquipseudomonas alcaligenes OT 69]|nr:hypothetical protein L682_21605 [Pseudomonas alcaligenes OT 69]